MTDRDRPVLTGLLALVAVAVAVGAVLGLATLAGTSMLGVGESRSAGAESTAEETLYLPTPSPTQAPTDPLVTLAPVEGQPSTTASPVAPTSEEGRRKAGKEKDEGISLSTGQREVSAMERIDLTGVYPGGEGAILQVQRFEGGSWRDFPVTVSVSGETFATYVQTGQPGETRFRVKDTDTGRTSNQVAVRVG